MRDQADPGANGILILSKAFEHEDSSADVNADAVALPVLSVDLFARQTEMAALIDVTEDAEAELDGMEDRGVEGAKSVFRLLYGDGSGHFTRYAFLVGGGVEVGLRLKVEAKATVDFAVRCNGEVVGQYLQELDGARFVILVHLVESAELVGMGHKIVDSTLLGLGFGWSQRPVVDRDQAAEGAIDCFDDVFFPEVAACTIGALFGDVEEILFLLPGRDFVRCHLLDQRGLLRKCGDGRKSQSHGSSSQFQIQTSTAIHGVHCVLVILSAIEYDATFAFLILMTAHFRLIGA